MLKIQKLETFANEFVCFVKLTAEDGTFGWGQTSTYNADITSLIFHRQVAPWALGADALSILPLIERIEEKNINIRVPIAAGPWLGWIPPCGT